MTRLMVVHVRLNVTSVTSCFADRSAASLLKQSPSDAVFLLVNTDRELVLALPRRDGLARA
jgi:hypothetical protein